MTTRGARVGLLVVSLLLAPGASAGQEVVPDTVDARIRQARELREERSFREAADRLRAYLRDRPDDVAMLRLLASTLRRAGEPAAAREAFEEALRRQPDDALLRLDYADLLVEREAGEEASRILAPVIRGGEVPAEVRADARVLLGRVARSAERDAEAEEEFRRALALTPGHPSALRQLREMYRQRVPWLRATVGRVDDDQPLTGTRSALEARQGVLPWLDARASASVVSLGGELSDETVPGARLGVGARWELLKLEASAWGGAFRGPADDAVDWRASGEVAYLGPGGLRLSVRGDRGPYLLTEASLDTTLAPAAFEGAVGRPDVAGWAGNLEYRQQRFDDDLKVEEFRAWILGPLLRDRGGTLRLGYEFRGADSSDMLFAPTREVKLPFEGPIPGRYDPVYTPEQLQEHRLLVDVRIETDGTLTGFLEGSWAFEAEEEAPLLFVSVPDVPQAGVGLQFQRRSYDPWHVGGRVRYLPIPGLEVVAGGGYRRAAFRSRSWARITATLYDLPDELR